MSRPIVIIPSCTKTLGGLTFDVVGRKYTAALAEVAECQPLMMPLGKSVADIGAVLDVADGILLSGSLSNVEPRLYSDELPLDPASVDRDRDALTLPLIRAAIERKLPLFAICRGFQEFNVALGGTLHQAVHTVDGHNDHREPTDEDYEIKFGPKHQVRLDGELMRCGEATILRMNGDTQFSERLRQRLRRVRHLGGIALSMNLPVEQRHGQRRGFR